MNRREEHGTVAQCWMTSQRCLEKVCEENSPLTLVTPDSEVLCHGSFAGLSEDSLMINIVPNQGPLFSERFCCVMFQYEGRRWAFCTTINGVVDGENRKLALAFPRQIVAERRRPALRLTVPQESEFGAKVTAGGREHEGRVLNIHMHGALVEFDNSIDDVKLGPIELELRMQDENVVIPTEAVRRERKTRIGFAFAPSSTGPQEWKSTLRPMLKKVDEDWLKLQRRVDDAGSIVDLDNGSASSPIGTPAAATLVATAR